MLKDNVLLCEIIKDRLGSMDAFRDRVTIFALCREMRAQTSASKQFYITSILTENRSNGSPCMCVILSLFPSP
jgi:hypothetical protein